MQAQVIFPIITKEMEQLPFYITGVGIDYEENGVTREEGYEDYQWAYCLDGEGIFKIEGQTYPIKKGTAFFFRKGIPHSYEKVAGNWRTYWITFNGQQVENLIEYMGIGSTMVLELEKDSEIKHRYKELFYTLSTLTNRHESMLKASGALYELMIYMQHSKISHENEGKNKAYQRLAPVMRYMDDHYQEDLALEDLAEQIGVTKYYLCRLFKGTYESKPFDYLNQIRIQKAKEYLVTQEQLKVKEIGELVGYNDTSYFCSKFRSYEGCSPVEFRKKYNSNTF